MTLFTVKISLTEDGTQEIPYDSVAACMRDRQLESLFAGELIDRCEIYCGDKRITALPIMDFKRLKEHLASNSATILRGLV